MPPYPTMEEALAQHGSHVPPEHRVGSRTHAVLTQDQVDVLCTIMRDVDLSDYTETFPGFNWDLLNEKIPFVSSPPGRDESGAHAAGNGSAASEPVLEVGTGSPVGGVTVIDDAEKA